MTSPVVYTALAELVRQPLARDAITELLALVRELERRSAPDEGAARREAELNSHARGAIKWARKGAAAEERAVISRLAAIAPGGDRDMLSAILEGERMSLAMNRQLFDGSPPAEQAAHERRWEVWERLVARLERVVIELEPGT